MKENGSSVNNVTQISTSTDCIQAFQSFVLSHTTMALKSVYMAIEYKADSSTIGLNVIRNFKF